MKIKFLIAASVAALTAATAANAADIIRNEPAPVVVAPMFSWTGAFAGVQIGGKWSDTNLNIREKGDVADPFKKGFAPDPSGFMGGIYAGYNYQFTNNIVLGVDTDFAWADMSKGSSADYLVEDSKGVASAVSLKGKLKEKWSGATRVRVGYAMDRWMPYLAGGVAYAKVNSSAKFNDVYGDEIYGLGSNKTLTGYTVGGGVEYALTDNVILRGEYRYSDFGNKSVSDDLTKYKVDYKTNDFRVGVAYKF